MKLCRDCKIKKTYLEFRKHSETKDKLYPICKTCHNHKVKLWRSQNKEKIVEQNRSYYEKNTKHCKQLCFLAKKRSLENPVQRMMHNLRNRIYQAIKRGSKSGSAIRDLGCTIAELKTYLESKFQPGMSWENYGQWHIDHIKPLSLFDLENHEDFRKAVNFSNLQPLWARDNLSKGNRHG